MSVKFTTLAPQQGDTIRILEAKILTAITGGAGGGGSGLVGVGSPLNVVTAAAGTTYWDSANNSFWVNQSGGISGWVQITA